MKCKRSSDARKLDQSGMHTMRMQALKAVENGQPVAEVAETFGVAERTLYRWLARFASDGQQGLKNRPKTGRPPKLDGGEMAWLARAIREETPQQLKFPYALWTLSLIGELIRDRLGKSLSPASVLRVMRLLGFTAQKPVYRAWQRDAVLVQKWQDEQYPQIRKEARKHGARIYFADESGLRSDYHLGTTWAPEGHTPVVEKTGRRFSVNMISAVSPGGELRFMVHQGTVNADGFIVFLKRLLADADRPIFLIVDGHPAHRAKKVREFVESTDDQLRLYFLPPYAPNLNPDEQVWAHVKREIGRRAVHNLEEMKGLARSALQRLQKLPKLVASFFRHPECNYTVT